MSDPPAARQAAPPSSSPPADATASTPPVVAVALAGVALAAAAVAILAQDDLVRAADVLRLVLASSFAAAGVAVARRRATRSLGAIVLAAVVAAGIEYVADSLLRRGDGGAAAEAVESLAAVAVVALAFHLLVVLPDGHPPTRTVRATLLAGHGVALVAGLWRWSQQPDPSLGPVLLLGVGLGTVGLVVSNRRYVDARGAGRQRMQWLGLALSLCAEIGLIVVALRVLIGWPPQPAVVVASSLVLVAGALAAGASPKLVGRVDRLLTHVVSFAGLSAVVTVIYLVIVIGLGRVPTEDERTILVLSMASAAISALAYLPARARLTEVANQLVYGEARDPSEALDTFGGRLTRALPMDELLLQLAELGKKHLGLSSSEVWTGQDGHFSRAASVPDTGPGRLHLGPKELPVVTRARVSGRGWAEVWLPQVVAGRPANGPLRVVPMAHKGELFGLMVLERSEGEDDFSEEDDRVLTELARQVAIALHNSALDTALQATLEEVQRKNVELQESRSRIVATGDRERRRIERNLHDGAQQHLVALAVKLRLIQRLGESDPAAALAMVDEARNDVLATVEEVRALAHGIYPPLLMDKGLPEALSAAAGRAALPTTVSAEGLGRYDQDVEAAVYFCCLEALQNAGKHAGEGAAATVSVVHHDGELRFSVTDDGAGFDPEGQSTGHGFVNMADRLGAIGGTVEVTSAPGRGTTISGRVPVVPLAPAAPADGAA